MLNLIEEADDMQCWRKLPLIRLRGFLDVAFIIGRNRVLETVWFRCTFRQSDDLQAANLLSHCRFIREYFDAGQLLFFTTNPSNAPICPRITSRLACQ